MFSHRQEWRETGVDLKGEQRMKAWKTKNAIDMALQPRRIHTERLTIPFPEGTTAAEIEATLIHRQRPGEDFVIHISGGLKNREGVKVGQDRSAAQQITAWARVRRAVMAVEDLLGPR